MIGGIVKYSTTLYLIPHFLMLYEYIYLTIVEISLLFFFPQECSQGHTHVLIHRAFYSSIPPHPPPPPYLGVKWVGSTRVISHHRLKWMRECRKKNIIYKVTKSLGVACSMKEHLQNGIPKANPCHGTLRHKNKLYWLPLRYIYPLFIHLDLQHIGRCYIYWKMELGSWVITLIICLFLYPRFSRETQNAINSTGVDAQTGLVYSTWLFIDISNIPNQSNTDFCAQTLKYISINDL